MFNRRERFGRRAQREDFWTIVYFDLVIEEDTPEDVGGDIEFEAIRELEELFGGRINNEGHNDYVLICNITATSREQLAKIYNEIVGNDGRVFTSHYCVAMEFYATERPGQDRGVLWEDWPEVYGI
jgi:hypothetical protein